MYLFKILILIKIFLLFVIFSSNSLALDFSKEELSFSKKYLSSTIKSNKPTEIVVATLIASRVAESELLEQFYAQGNELGINDRLWLDQVIKKCLISEENINCNPSEFINKLKILDDSNALPHIYSAIYQARNNKLSMAYEELRKATNKKIYDDYYWKRFSLLLKTLEGIGYPNERLHTASIKFSHNMVGQPYRYIMGLCNKQAELSLKWKNTCIKLGKLLEKKGVIFYANMVGFALQREALSFDENDANKLIKVKVDRESLNQWRINAVQKLDFIMAQKKGPDSYYSDLVKLGEREAIENALTVYYMSIEKNNKSKQ